MDPKPQHIEILTEEQLQKVTPENLNSVIESHRALFASNAVLSYQNMQHKEFLKNILSDEAGSISLVFTNFESGQRGYEQFTDKQEADERFDYLCQYYSEAVHVPVEIGIAVVVKLEKHNWHD